MFNFEIKAEMKRSTNIFNIQLKKFNFEHVFRPVYYFLRFSGQWSFSIFHDSNGTIQKACIGFSDALWTILLVCAYSAIVFSSYKKLMKGQEIFENRQRFVAENIFQIGSLVSGVFGIVLNVINRNKLVDIFKKFNTFDNEVSTRSLFPI